MKAARGMEAWFSGQGEGIPLACRSPAQDGVTVLATPGRRLPPSSGGSDHASRPCEGERPRAGVGGFYGGKAARGDGVWRWPDGRGSPGGGAGWGGGDGWKVCFRAVSIERQTWPIDSPKTR
ncbi:MAG: hypothetical protein FWG74_01555 [Planctomycetes bacterium]|nr:hypothetical protein [Planctomycetota bacterium]